MKITKAPDGMLTYRYAAGPDVSFKFHLLCEVGEPWQPEAQTEITRRGWVVDYGRSMDRAPWCADFAAVREYQPKTGQPCHCQRGQQRDNCPDCEGTGHRIDFARIRGQR